MPVSQKIIKYLDGRKVKYELIHHRTVYTAYDKSATLRVPPKIIGKTLVMKLSPSAGGLALVLIPANKNLDKNRFKKMAKALSTGRQVRSIDFASERLIKNKLKGVKVGAIPPFGNLFKLPTFIDRSLLKAPKIIINGGNHNFSIKISPATFKKLMSGSLMVGNFAKGR